ncbi:MAG: hypothetical protein JXD22_11360 [Sedimentisphaerales bacterium]|nr:hypothetical protein [Sedimentisphaerales bacterium]
MNRSKLLTILFFFIVLFSLISCSIAAKVPDSGNKRWQKYVTNCLDTMIDHGRDVYGPVKSPLFMAVLEVDTLVSPEKPEPLDSLLRLEGRITRRGERGSDVWMDQAMLRTMYDLSKITGEKKYAAEADTCLDYFMKVCVKKNGLFVWGSHLDWNCYEETIGGDRGPHEILINIPIWHEMYRINPEAVKREVDMIWRWHVYDKETGAHNRHDTGRSGVDFSFAGGSFVVAFSFMYSVTGEKHYMDKAKMIANWHWRHRNRRTNLTSENPSRDNPEKTGPYLYGRTFMTTISGPHAASLLRAYEISGEKYFYDVASSYLKAYDKYAWVEKEQTYYGMLNLDGTFTTADDVPDNMKNYPGSGKRIDPGHSIQPIGPVDVWPTTIYPLIFPLASAQSSIYAYEISVKKGKPDPVLLQSAKRWAIVIEKQLPAKTGWTLKEYLEEAMPKAKETGGTYPTNYARAISFYLHLYKATKTKKYLQLAEDIAGDAVNKLYVETVKNDPQGRPKTYGIFKGHPAKPYYETTGGVGMLLYALLELDNLDKDLDGAF